MSDHSDCLKKLCRVCGEVISNQRVTYDCKEKTENLTTININAVTDNPTIHPRRFCNKCYRTTKNIQIHGTKTSLKIIQWTKHSDDGNCETCNSYNQRSKGGRKTKARKGGRHTAITNGQMLHRLNSLKLSQAYTSSVPLKKDRFSPLPDPMQLKDFVCHLCDNVLDAPVETVCAHVVCKLCMFRSLYKDSSNKPSCPVCSTDFTTLSDIRPPTTALTNILLHFILCLNLQTFLHFMLEVEKSLKSVENVPTLLVRKYEKPLTA